MNLVSYLKEVKTELSKVKWPTRKAATQMTLIVIIASVLVGLYIGALDLGFTNLLGLILN